MEHLRLTCERNAVVLRLWAACVESRQNAELTSELYTELAALDARIASLALPNRVSAAVAAPPPQREPSRKLKFWDGLIWGE